MIISGRKPYCSTNIRIMKFRIKSILIAQDPNQVTMHKSIHI